jgi:segregation and condensation protein B
MADTQPPEASVAAQLEAVLFVAAEPAGIAELAKALEIAPDAVEAGLTALEEQLTPRGLRLQRHGARVQLTTAPELAGKVETFLGLEARTHLTRSALETLAIVAYNQPLTRPQIDSVRGVNSDSMLKSLLYKGLISELGRTQGPGRPILYGTTPEFLQYLGLNSIADLPPLKLQEAADSHEELLKD